MNGEEHLADVPALTLVQPWAYAVTNCGKTVENRSWPTYASVHRILVHAGKRYDPRSAAATFTRLGFMLPPDPVRGAVVAVADIAFVCDGRVKGECGCGPWAVPGQCHWNLTNVLAVPEPVPCGGRQGLWRPPAEVVAAVAAQLTQLTEEISA